MIQPLSMLEGRQCLAPSIKFYPINIGYQSKKIYSGCVGSKWESFCSLRGLSSISKKLIHLVNIQILLNSIIELLKLTSINNYVIDLVRNKQTLFSPVYKLGETRNSENSRFWASFSRFHHFEPHFIGSLHFFDLVFIASGPCFQNTCPISVISMQRVLKWASWQIYKNNGYDMKLSCKAIERRQSELNNQNQIIWTKHLELKGGLKSKRTIKWPRILLIHMTFEWLQHSSKCHFYWLKR